MEAYAAEIESRIGQASSKAEALDNAIAAVDAYMKAVSSATTSSEKSRLKTKCKSILARAEEIKRTETWVTGFKQEPLSGQPSRTVKLLKAPVSARKLSAREQIILIEGSRLHGFLFPEWTTEPGKDAFEAGSTGGIFTDEADLGLSHLQEKAVAGWKRPRDALQRNNSERDYELELERVRPTMSPVKAVDLVQDVTADCSVVAGLCAAVARVEGDPLSVDDQYVQNLQLLNGVIYPYDSEKLRPQISENGKYVFRFHFNGCFRRVVIDDRLPASKTQRTLFVTDRQNPGLLWPALLEKAYLKMRGGYDFPGSNSGTDLYVLSGWIPEQIFLQRETQPEKVWNRLHKSYGFGDVIITLGTGRLTQKEEEGLGLAGEHDYAVLKIKEESGQRMLLVKNPWCNGTVWKEYTSVTSTGIPGLDSVTQELEDFSHNSEPVSPGTFWISFEKVIHNFESMYLNWNPGLFRYCEDRHFNWKVPTVAAYNSFSQNPQYSLHSAKGGSIWVLLSRHFTTEEYQLLKKSKQQVSPNQSPLGYISLYCFEADGHRVQVSDNACHAGPYVDSPQTLARLEMTAGTTYTLVVAQQALPFPKYSFTISAFSREPVVLEMAKSQYPHHNNIQGSWNYRTAGGNASSVSYSSNPQYSLSTSTNTHLMLMLETDNSELAIQLTVIWSDGKRVSSITSRDILGSSGEYQRGSTIIKLEYVAQGNYTIVCSTFEPGQLGKFNLSVESTEICQVKALPGEAAGMTSLILPRLNMPVETERCLAPILVNRITRLRVIARQSSGRNSPMGSPHPRASLRLSIERGQGPHKNVLATSSSGSFSDNPGGIRTSEIDISPEMASRGGIWLVVEIFGGSGMQGVFDVEVEVLCDVRLEVGPWGSGEG